VILYCATGNPGKLREFELATSRFGQGVWTFVPLTGVPPCDETGTTFEENARQKAAYYGPHAPGPLFAEDSGLEVDALGGDPGVYSARFAGPGATDEANNRLLVEKLRGAENRVARYVCVVALYDSDQPVVTFRGEVEGLIVDEARGANGFGYDPYFYYPPFGCTMAEASPERKLEVSHRGKALRLMLTYLTRRNGV
jgi:XTP/dITP diphosphohydrolase